MMASSHNRVIKQVEAPRENIGFYIFKEEKAPERKKKPLHAAQTECIAPEQPQEDGQEQKPQQAQLPKEEQAETEAQIQDILEAARQQGEAILAQARAQAESMKEQMIAQAEAACRSAWEEARQKGYTEGADEGKQQALEEGRQKTKEAILSFEKEVRQALQSIEEAKTRCLENYLDELKDCSIAVAEKVIHISLRSSGDVIRQMIINATEKLKRSAWVKIYIDRMDYEMLLEVDQNILDELAHLSDSIKFVVMEREEEGTCVIERPEEVLDISVNSQMENIKEILKNA